MRPSRCRLVDSGSGAGAPIGWPPTPARAATQASTSRSRWPTRPGEIGYEHFEGGFGPLNVERVHQFAELLRVDPYGILTGVEICSPDFAVRTADNKFMTMFYLQLQEFDERTGDAIALLDAYCLMDAFREMFAKLEAEARRREALTAQRPSGGQPSENGPP